MNFQIGFWIIFGIIITIMTFFIWLCIQKNQDDHIMQISKIGLSYLLNQYLIKSFQKVCILLLLHSNKKPIIKNLNQEEISSQQIKFLELYKDSLTKSILKFARGKEVVSSIFQTINQKEFKDMDIFILPDVIISKNDYYKSILELSSKKTLEKALIMTNDDSKKYIDDLIKKSINISSN